MNQKKAREFRRAFREKFGRNGGAIKYFKLPTGQVVADKFRHLYQQLKGRSQWEE